MKPTKPIAINFDSDRYIAVKSSNYPDKLFVYDLLEYGRLNIQLVERNPDPREIKCYQITQEGNIDFEKLYLAPLNSLNGTIIKNM